MIQITEDPASVSFTRGFYAASTRTPAARKDKDDLGLLLSSVPAQVAAVYTQNLVQAAPLRLNQIHLEGKKQASALIVNSGNANAAAPNDMENALRMAQKTADQYGLLPEDVLVASTGVIGQELDIDSIEQGIEALQIEENALLPFTRAIMTTDTVEKAASVTFEIKGVPVTISGVCKGSGMIAPNMATMLCFVTTDCAIEQPLLQKALSWAVDRSFNRISVDGDTSTNDMVLLFSNGFAGNEPITQKNASFKLFEKALRKLLKNLAIRVVRDGEGASKLIKVTVTGAPSKKDALALAKSVATSSLFKAAIFGKDANWGRVLCALGYSGTPFDPNTVDISFKSSVGSIEVCKSGRGLLFNEQKAAAIMEPDTIEVLINLHQGDRKASFYGCDLSDEYVYINSDYRS